ncbi:MAG: penicillinase repressor [Crocinitomicaceae bacterium]|nr:penicillinase repressor [Crocinitomicaceae bacterium]|tara:strand:- start:3489 stop:3869 length:381 start_codon:yes stop_codon:yes gene_type:complete
MKELNNTELEVMEFLWKLKKGFMKDIVELFPEPKPAYTTIATLLSRMVDKKYIGFNKLGRDKQYFPILNKEDYFSSHLKKVVTQFFNGSPSQFASFFTSKTDLTVEELDELKSLVESQINKKKGSK